jgi:hypothetical protein
MAETSGDEIFGFNLADTDALIRLIGGDSTGGGTGGDTYDATKLLIAVATSGVPARSGTTLGKAAVAVKHLTVSGVNRIIADSGFNVDAFNLAGTAVATGALVMLLRLGDVHVVVWEECPE